jgi:hypothetical protein
MLRKQLCNRCEVDGVHVASVPGWIDKFYLCTECEACWLSENRAGDGSYFANFWEICRALKIPEESPHWELGAYLKRSIDDTR